MIRLIRFVKLICSRFGSISLISEAAASYLGLFTGFIFNYLCLYLHGADTTGKFVYLLVFCNLIISLFVGWLDLIVVRSSSLLAKGLPLACLIFLLLPSFLASKLFFAFSSADSTPLALPSVILYIIFSAYDSVASSLYIGLSKSSLLFRSAVVRSIFSIGGLVLLRANHDPAVILLVLVLSYICVIPMGWNSVGTNNIVKSFGDLCSLLLKSKSNFLSSLVSSPLSYIINSYMLTNGAEYSQLAAYSTLLQWRKIPDTINRSITRRTLALVSTPNDYNLFRLKLIAICASLFITVSLFLLSSWISLTFYPQLPGFEAGLQRLCYIILISSFGIGFQFILYSHQLYRVGLFTNLLYVSIVILCMPLMHINDVSELFNLLFASTFCNLVVSYLVLRKLFSLSEIVFVLTGSTLVLTLYFNVF